ncbi:Ig-like domain-containing protein [Pseudoduganella sp. LjRoot289]|uniref:Ig-like domain-containing protein n=1 Tax=Pseudoduganella sp. LjRoot289 TaxID=3342314 RepID=UPI003ECC8529
MSQIIPVASAPVLTSATPADNTGAVSASADIVLNFSAAVHAGSGYITISDGAMQTYMGRDGLLHTRMVGATDTRTISMSDTSQVSISGGQVTINLAADLKAGLSYSVQMGSGALLGESGLSYAGLLDATKLNFSVSSASATPVAPTAVVDFLSMYSYSSETPFITNIANQHFSGTFTGQLGSGDKVQVSIDGATWHDATVDGSGWGYDSTISASGTLRARVTGSTGLSSEVKSQAYTYDIAGPSVSSMTLSKAALGVGESATLTVVFTEKVSGLTLESFGMHNSTLSGLESSTDGLSWTATVTMGTEGLPGGDVTINASSVKDVAGNYGTGSVTEAYTRGAVSLAGLTVGLDSDSDNDTGQYQDDHLTNTTTPTVYLDIDGVSGLVTGDRIGIYEQAGNALLGSYTLTDSDFGAYGGRVSVTVSGLDDGVHNLVARATDAAGSVGTASSTALAVTIDTDAPGVASTSPSGEGAVESSLKTITITFDEDIAWASGNGIIIDSAEQELLNLTFETSIPSDPENPSHSYLTYDDDTRVLTIHLKDTLPAGASYRVLNNGQAIFDVAGNDYAGSATLLNFRIADNGVTLPGAPTVTVTDSGAADGITNAATVLVTGLSASHWIYSVDGGESYSLEQDSDGDSASFTLPSDGVYEAGKIRVVQYDTAEQKSEAGQVGSALTLDTTAPEAAIASAGGFSHTDTSIAGTYTGTLLSDDHIEYSVNGGDWQQASTGDGIWTASGLALASASDTLAVRVADSAGNVADNGFFPGSTGPSYFGGSGNGQFTAGDGTVLLAGAGDDEVTLSGGATGYIDGGDGYDTLTLNASLNLTTSAGLFESVEELVLADDTTLTIGDFSNLERLNLPSSIVSGYTTLTVEGGSSSRINLSGSNAWQEVTLLNAEGLSLLAVAELLTGHEVYVNTSAHLILLVGSSTVQMPGVA